MAKTFTQLEEELQSMTTKMLAGEVDAGKIDRLGSNLTSYIRGHVARYEHNKLVTEGKTTPDPWFE